MQSEPTQSPISQCLSIMQNWMQANCPRFIETEKLSKLKVYTMWDDYFRPELNFYQKCSFSHIWRRNSNRNLVNL